MKKLLLFSFACLALACHASTTELNARICDEITKCSGQVSAFCAAFAKDPSATASSCPGEADYLECVLSKATCDSATKIYSARERCVYPCAQGNSALSTDER